eukprot:GGOE01057103.1.p3 GENE.GGOE01057103.1~~GGOE01057103.1.p3  ORF type:complete len:100 (+),score=1.36 GGOE01057103.1:197-496(+)
MDWALGTVIAGGHGSVAQTPKWAVCGCLRDACRSGIEIGGGSQCSSQVLSDVTGWPNRGLPQQAPDEVGSDGRKKREQGRGEREERSIGLTPERLTSSN